MSKGKIWFLAHPHRFKSMRGRLFCPWNISENHNRKFLFSDSADYLDKDGNLYKGKSIYFLGEFECCSEVRVNPTTSRYKYIHTPFFTDLDYLPEVLNTDPFVFGDRFYYGCCKMDNAIKWNLDVGDIIIFGSYTKNNNTQIIVDTVMVLGRKICRKDNPYSMFPSAYYDATLSKLPIDRPLWEGRMITDYPECFSFVPCRTDENFPLPIITILGYVGAQNIKPMEVHDIESVYRDIKRQLFEQGFYLGVKIDMPSYKIVGSCGADNNKCNLPNIKDLDSYIKKLSDLDTRNGKDLRNLNISEKNEDEYEDII